MSNRTLPTNVSITTHAPTGKTFKNKSNGHTTLEVRADYAVWDTSTNAYVSVDDTNLKDPV